MRSPPLDPPATARRSGLVYRSWISHSAAATKSSKLFCFRPSIPPWCHASPYSPPPRRFGIATRPPCSSQSSSERENAGVMLMLKPPYPVR